MFNMCGFKHVFNTCGHFSCEHIYNIVLSGGNTMFPGIATECSRKSPPSLLLQWRTRSLFTLREILRLNRWFFPCFGIHFPTDVYEQTRIWRICPLEIQKKTHQKRFIHLDIYSVNCFVVFYPNQIQWMYNSQQFCFTVNMHIMPYDNNHSWKCFIYLQLWCLST